MCEVQNLLKTTHTFLKSCPVYSSLPMSVLSLGLEKMAELNLSCPCNSWNEALITLIFIAPALFLWALMFVWLAPFRYCSKDVCCTCCLKVKCYTSDNTSENISKASQLCWKAFAHSLFPSIMWVIWLFLDGDYLACSYTTWEGDYVFDQKLNRKWCAPYERANATNENDLHQKYQKIVGISQVIGYAILGFFGLLIIMFFWRFYIETKENDVQTKQVEDGMESAGQVEDGMESAGQVEDVMESAGRVETLELHTQDPNGSRVDMQTGAHSSAQDPRGKVEEDIEDERKSLLAGSSQL